MKAVSGIAVLLLLGLLLPYSGLAKAESQNERSLRAFRYMWVYDVSGNAGTLPDSAAADWKNADAGRPMPFSKPAGASAAWIELDIGRNDCSGRICGLYISRLYAQNVSVYVDGRMEYETRRNYRYDVNEMLLPLRLEGEGRLVYLRLETATGKLGIPDFPVVGDYQRMLVSYVKRDLFDIVLGGAYLFMGLAVFFVALFARRSRFASWMSLFVILISTGILILTCTPIMYAIWHDYGQWMVRMSNLALYMLLPAITIFVEGIFGKGTFRIVGKLRVFQIIFMAFCTAGLLLNELTSYRFSDYCFFLSDIMLGGLTIVQFAILAACSIARSRRGSRDSVILTAGLGILAVAVAIDLVRYAANFDDELYVWKIGTAGFAFSLIAILGRGIREDQIRLLRYSRELKVYFDQLQQSDKMEIISQLAASIAHEVRNPLQVTRGFLQLLSKKSEKEQDKSYLLLAMDELDRASKIITDYLTFAKPQLESVQTLRVSEEMAQIAGMLVPLANMRGGEITVDVPDHLYVKGNPSKFKQAFVNVLKNSIEAFDGQGEIRMWAYQDRQEVVIHIRDNGEGMDEEVVAKLGEPYFSNKAKGTGLGLLVTIRIVEAMKGKIEFHSRKGHGTEVIVRLPAEPPAAELAAP